MNNEIEIEIEPYVPAYCRPPNKLIRIEIVPIDDGNGHVGLQRVAVFKTKSGELQKCMASIQWVETESQYFQVCQDLWTIQLRRTK